MKTLLLVRHAKSSWNDPSVNDFERPLNERGKKDAPMMARRLLQKKVEIELFVSSPAKRAKTTARFFAEEFGKKEKEILLVPELYQAGPEAFLEVIGALDDAYDHAAIFSHNPGISGFANTLTEVRVDDMPTCAVFGLQCPVQKWADFSEGEKSFLFFDYPKSEKA